MGKLYRRFEDWAVRNPYPLMLLLSIMGYLFFCYAWIFKYFVFGW